MAGPSTENSRQHTASLFGEIRFAFGGRLEWAGRVASESACQKRQKERKEKKRYLSEFVEFGVGLHAAESNLGERLAPRGARQRSVQDRTHTRLFGQEGLGYPQVGRQRQSFRYILLQFAKAYEKTNKQRTQHTVG